MLYEKTKYAIVAIVLILIATFFANNAIAQGSEPQPVFVKPIKLSDSIPSDVGSIHAGLLCLPRGSASKSVFSDALPNAQMVVVEALQRRGWVNASAATDGMNFGKKETANFIVVTVSKIKVNLCARKWGVFGFGDQQSLSGTATFDFSYDWLSEDGLNSHWEDQQILEIKPKKPLKLLDIFTSSVEQSVNRFSDLNFTDANKP